MYSLVEEFGMSSTIIHVYDFSTSILRFLRSASDKCTKSNQGSVRI